MKSIKYIGLFCLACIGMCFASCNDDDDQGSSPINVTQIYLEDYKSNVPDRAVDFARLGQMIRIEGSGFKGMKKVYINGYDTYFNVTYVNDMSMLVTIDKKTPVVEADEAVRNTIRLVKSGTEYTHSFTIRSASPSVTSLSSTLPQPGEKVYVYGANLQETTKVTLPGGVVVTSIESDEEGEWYAFTMPSGVTEGGSIYSEGANGMAATPGYFNYTQCMILNWDGVGTESSWSWTANGSMIGTKADDASGELREMVQDPLNSGRGECVQLIPDRLLNAGGAVAKQTRVAECWTAGNGNDMDDWTRMYTYIPAETPLTEVAFQFDIYVPQAWVGTGQIEVVLFNNFNFGGIGSDEYTYNKEVAVCVPWLQDGKVVPFQTTGWQTMTIPFSEFRKYAALIADAEAVQPTFQNVVEDRNGSSYRNFGMGFTNGDFELNGVEYPSSLFKQKIYVDNFRIVPYTKVTISDFDDEDETE